MYYIHPEECGRDWDSLYVEDFSFLVRGFERTNGQGKLVYWYQND